MYKKTGRNSGVYELQPLDIDYKEPPPPPKSPYKTHIRRPSFAPKDIQLAMIDDSPLAPNHEIILADPKAESPYLVEKHTLVTVETKSPESSLMSPSMISSNTNDNNNLIKNRRRDQKPGCFRRVFAPCCCLILLLLAACAIVYYFTSQQSSEDSAGILGNGTATETTGSSDKLVAEAGNADAVPLPITSDYGTSTRYNRKSSIPIETTAKTVLPEIVPSLPFPAYLGSMKQVPNISNKDFVFSPLAIDETVLLLDQKVDLQRRNYFGSTGINNAAKYIGDTMATVNNYGFNDVHGFFTKSRYSIDDSENLPTLKNYPISHHSPQDLDFIPNAINFMNTKFAEKSQIYQEFDLKPFMSNMTQDELLPVSLFHFSMNFKEGFSYISKDELDFHTPNSKIMMKKICGMMNATVNFLSKNGQNSTLITVPLQDSKFRFFVYVGNNTNSNYSLPTLDLEFLTENLKTVGPLTVENLVLPKINKVHVTDLSSVVYGFSFPTFCVKIPRGSAPCIYLEKIIHATHFTLDYDGINVPKKDKVDEAEIKGQIIEVDRPFYYGVWFNDNIDQSLVYFGSYHGHN